MNSRRNSHQRHKFLRAEASRNILKFRVSEMTFPGDFKKYFPPRTPCCFVTMHKRLGTMQSKYPRRSMTGADPRFFLGGGALVSCSTSTPINHIVFFWQNTSCIRKPQVISRTGGGAHPLHPPPRSPPA